MYDNRFTSLLYKPSHPSQALGTSGKIFDTAGSTPPPRPDNFAMYDRDDRVAMMTPTRGAVCVSPQTLAITPPRPASPIQSDADSEYLDDGSNSPSSFTGEECPDLCGGPKNSCRSWTPPASPFYYTNESGIFLLDDRQNYKERQTIELEHMLRHLDGRLLRLRETMSPPRFLSRLHETESSTPLSPSGKSHGPSERFPRSPTEGLAEQSCVTSTFPKPYPCDCDGVLRRCKVSPTQDASASSLSQTIYTQEKDERGTADLGKLIHTSLQHVQSTNSPPRYLAHVSKTEAQPLLGEPVNLPNSHEEQRDEVLLVKHASLHLGNSAYPTPLPSSPESKPSRKRGRDDASQESSGRKRSREDDEWISTHRRLRNDTF